MATTTFLPLVYEELRLLARRYMSRERRDHSLDPTALVHEAYLRMVRIHRVEWQGKTHFLAVAATQMRRVLVEHSRRIRAGKRGGRQHRVTLHDRLLPANEPSVDLLDLDEALRKLAQRNTRQARGAELRLFAGLTFDEIGKTLGITDRTAKRDWLVSRSWLAMQLDQGEGYRE